MNSKLAKRNGATDAANADKADKAEKWFNSRSISRRRERTVPAQAVQHDVADRPRAEPALLGSEARVRAGRDPQHGRRDAVHQRPARHARGRDRPFRAARAVAAKQQPRQREDAALDVGVLAVREQQPGNLRCDAEQAIPVGRSLRARLPLLRGARGRRRDPGARDHPVHVPGLIAPGIGCQPKPQQGEEPSSPPREWATRRSPSSIPAT